MSQGQEQMSEIEQGVVPLGGVDAPITKARLQEVRELLASIPRADPDSLTGNVQGMLYLIDQQAEALAASEAARLELVRERDEALDSHDAWATSWGAKLTAAEARATAAEAALETAAKDEREACAMVAHKEMLRWAQLEKVYRESINNRGAKAAASVANGNAEVSARIAKAIRARSTPPVQS